MCGTKRKLQQNVHPKSRKRQMHPETYMTHYNLDQLIQFRTTCTFRQRIKRLMRTCNIYTVLDDKILTTFAELTKIVRDLQSKIELVRTQLSFYHSSVISIIP